MMCGASGLAVLISALVATHAVPVASDERTWERVEKKDPLLSRKGSKGRMERFSFIIHDPSFFVLFFHE